MTHPNSGMMGATGGLQGGGAVSDFKRCSPRGEETVGQRRWNLRQSEKVSCFPARVFLVWTFYPTHSCLHF